MDDEPDQLGQGNADIGARWLRQAAEMLPLLRDEVAVPLRTDRKSRKRCRHFVGVTLVAETRTVECRKCGATRDAFDELLVLARDGDDLAAVTRRLEQKHDEIDALGREEARIKARVRNWRKKPGAFDAQQLIAVAVDTLKKTRVDTAPYWAIETLIAKMQALNAEDQLKDYPS